MIMGNRSFVISEIAEDLRSAGITVEIAGSANRVVEHLKNIELADDRSLTFYIGRDPMALDHLKECSVLCLPGVKPGNETVTSLFTEDPKLAFYIAAQKFMPEPPPPGVHPTAILHPEARVHPSASIGPFCLIDKCVIGEGTHIQSHVRIGENTRIGKNVQVETGTYVGATGQVWAWDKQGRKWIMPQLGGVVVEDDCFIGSNVSLVRGALQDTVLRRGCRIAHGSMIGHNCHFGRETFVSNGVAIAGAVTTGKYCFLGSGSRYRPGIRLGDNVTVGVGAVVIESFLEEGAVLAGVPAKIIKRAHWGEKLTGFPVKPNAIR